ncbi:MAG: beta-ketoacyl synthase N-terminal-like domain-containing protein [Spirochaetales bacterium]|nr:beta-ketoacyl synthase N-terminal-like domain-containing protein [Spirochaetales bacterium]
MTPVYIEDLGIVIPQAKGKEACLEAFLSGDDSAFRRDNTGDMECPTSRCPVEMKEQVKTCGWNNEVLSILKSCCEEIRPAVDRLKESLAAHRIGVIVGTSGYGSDESQAALGAKDESGSFPGGYELKYQQAHLPADYVQDYFSLSGYCGALATACASGASAVAEGVKLIRAGLADAVIVGGCDNVSDLVLKGFISLEAVDGNRTKPFSQNRRGINIGEGAALLLLTKESHLETPIRVAGVGNCSDGHHITAPDPTGEGAARAMREALSQADLDTVDYINLHGTGTPLNDSMEGKATAGVFESCPPCSSTKALTGHTLGASGAIELGLCWMLLSELNKENRLPPHKWDGEADRDIPPMNFCPADYGVEELNSTMSNSYAFGGWDLSIVLAKEGRL